MRVSRDFHSPNKATLHGHLDVVEYLLSVGVERQCRRKDGDNVIDLATSLELQKLLKNYEKRLCVIVCEELSKKENTLVFLHIAPLILEYM